MYPSAVWILLALSSTAYRQPSISQGGVRRYVAVSNEIGYRLQRVQSYQQGNQLLSPYGVSKLLSVLYQGTGGLTQQQIGRLGYGTLEQQGVGISQSYQQLRRYLQRNSEGSQLEEATALLYPSDNSVLPQYEQVLESSYRCLVQQVDYRQGRGGAAQDINRWVQEQTRGRISQISDVGASSGVQLLNGVYYEGSLQLQSGQEELQQFPFYNEGESSPQSVLYYQTQSRYPYYQDQQLQAVKLPYQGRDYSLLVVLPTKQSGVRQLQQEVSTGTIQRILSRSQETQIRVSLPQFRLDHSCQLEQDIQSLGIISIFGAGAELSGFSSRRSTYVSQIAQRAVVQVGGYESGQEGEYEGQRYRYGAEQDQHKGQYRDGIEGQYEGQYQPEQVYRYEDQYRARQKGQYGAGQEDQYEGQRYRYRVGQDQYEGQYGAGVEGQYEDRYGAGQVGQYESQSRTGQEGKYEGQYGTGQEGEYEGQYRVGQEGQYEGQRQYQYGDGRYGARRQGQYRVQREYAYGGSSDQSGVAEFQADRPFLFYVIHEPTGLNLLAGRVSQL